MLYLTINEIKKHLNLDENFNDDNEYLESLEAVAVDLVQRHIDTKLEDIASEDPNGKLPSGLLHAIKLTVGNMYENREGVAPITMSEVPQNLMYILTMYRNFNGKGYEGWTL